MTRNVKFAGVLLVVGMIARCDTTQPTLQGARTVQLQIYSFGSTVEEQDVWEKYRDLNSNNERDANEPIEGYDCGSETYFVERVFRVTPWTYAAEVTVVRAGTAIRTFVTSPAAASGFPNVTVGDSEARTGFPASPPGNPSPAFRYTNPTRMYATNPIALAACYSVPFPQEQLDGVPGPTVLELLAGDTVIVKAGRNPAPIVVGVLSDEGQEFASTFTVDGVGVQPTGIRSTTENGGRLYFSYTVR